MVDCNADLESYRDQAQLGVYLVPHAPVGLGGRLEVVAPVHYKFDIRSGCKVWTRPLFGAGRGPGADTTPPSSDMRKITDFRAEGLWIPWISRDVLCQVEQTPSDIGRRAILHFVEASQQYLQPNNEYRFELTYLVPTGIQTPSLSENKWWVYAYRKNEATPHTAGRVDGFSLHKPVREWQVFAVSREAMFPDPTVGGVSLELYFVAKFRENIDIGHTVVIKGPLGYDFSNYCDNIEAVEYLHNKWRTARDQLNTLGHFALNCTNTDMLMTRTQTAWQSITTFGMRVVAENPMTDEAWNLLDNYWQINVGEVLGRAVTVIGVFWSWGTIHPVGV